MVIGELGGDADMTRVSGVYYAQAFIIFAVCPKRRTFVDFKMWLILGPHPQYPMSTPPSRNQQWAQTHIPFPEYWDFCALNEAELPGNQWKTPHQLNIYLALNSPVQLERFGERTTFCRRYKEHCVSHLKKYPLAEPLRTQLRLRFNEFRGMPIVPVTPTPIRTAKTLSSSPASNKQLPEELADRYDSDDYDLADGHCRKLDVILFSKPNQLPLQHIFNIRSITCVDITTLPLIERLCGEDRKQGKSGRMLRFCGKTNNWAVLRGAENLFEDGSFLILRRSWIMESECLGLENWLVAALSSIANGLQDLDSENDSDVEIIETVLSSKMTKKRKRRLGSGKPEKRARHADQEIIEISD
ncbi:hypothetical protein MIND_01145000 [Mycena indigotica]|uniref:Uncharacterized protein n=1 Tax=Mycena indigotica TaxID=2126181 RepID=A0A8H6S7Q9_9AGAR|nr:uncharacterized protein MIND_01145000 [Mycena indigotica]KAF7293651.1 hypothetical protein MIND_01145000 [Mycena indigotica]